MSSIFERMGMFGLDTEEDFFLAATLTGDPLLMIGTHGCGKTYFSAVFADTLKAKYQMYDASKAMFEDILGFPDMKSLMDEDESKRTIRYLPTPMSVLDKEFVLVDEISRAHVQMQNKWLEVIRSKQVMGVKAPFLKWVWAAMNPLSYEGAVPLDEALAGRFAWVITMPEAHNMDDADAMQVAMNENADDAPAIGKWSGSKAVKTDLPTDEVFEILNRAGRMLPQVQEDYAHAIASYTVRLMKTLASKYKTNLDGRRISMIRRNILSTIAVKKARSDSINLESLVFTILLKSMPNAATGKDISASDLLAAHNLSKNALYMQKDVNYLITIEKDWIKKICIALSNKRDVTPMLLNEVLGTVAREDEHAAICAAVAPIVLKFAPLFDIEVVNAVSDKMAQMVGIGAFDFTLDRSTVLAYEDFQEATRESKRTPVGTMAMRVAAYRVKTADDVKVNLDDFTNMYRRTRDRVERAVSTFKAPYQILQAMMQKAEDANGQQTDREAEAEAQDE